MWLHLLHKHYTVIFSLFLQKNLPMSTCPMQPRKNTGFCLKFKVLLKEKDLIIPNLHLIQAEVLYLKSGMILQLWVKNMMNRINFFCYESNICCHVFDYQIIVSINEWTESTGANVNSLLHVHQEIKDNSIFF